jgi:5-formyltetrahydrofolate cyclo-ligase
MNDKAALRAAARAQRHAFVNGNSETVAISAPSELIAMLNPWIIVASYRPVGSEACPHDIENAAIAHGCAIAYPRIDQTDEPLSFRRVATDTDWETGPHGLVQPAAHTAICRPMLAIIPLLAFDRHGNRLGQGGGYYDRTAAAMPKMLRVGLAWSIQEVAEVPHDAHDQRMTAVITEQEWIWTAP